MRAKALVAILVSLLFCAMIGAVDAFGDRALLTQEASEYGEGWLQPAKPNQVPSQIYGACGVAISPLTGYLYLSNYYHRAVSVFTPFGRGEGAIQLPSGNPFLEINVLDSVCGLAFDSSGNLYANELHERVLLLSSGGGIIDSNKSTGVAVDGAGNVYVDDRTYVAKYAAPVTPGEVPVEKIALGSLDDGYGIAVDSKGQRVYLPDAAGDVVKVYEPAVDLVEPVATIDGPGGAGFVSLADAAVAVDASPGEGNGHLLVIDNVKPGAEEPEAAVYEFDAAGDFLGRLIGRRSYGGIGERRLGPIFGEPSGITVDAKGNVYVTTGNDEKANVLKYGPYLSSSLAMDPSPVEESSFPPGGSGARVAAESAEPSPPPHRGASASDIVQKRGVRVNFYGKLTPRALPRRGTAPVGIAIDASIVATDGAAPPQLRKIAIEINRHGRFETRGLPVCRLHDIQPSTTANALAACRGSLVGEGHFSANVKLPEQSPFPSAGKVLAFNGRLQGKPAILAHIYGTEPAPTSTVLPFLIEARHGTYGTALEASLPQATGDWGYVTGLKMTLRRNFHYRGKGRSYLSAGCPAPPGFPSAIFPLARTSFDFAGDLTLESVLNRSCKAKG